LYLSFFRETLRNKDVISFINDTFIFWSCSKDLPEGHRVFNALKGRRCPFLGVIVYKQSRMTLVARIEGPVKSDELIAQLGNIVADNSYDLSIARLARDQRAQDQELRKQQDEAYLESLKADKEKERKKQEQLEAQKRAELEEKQKIENEKQKEIVFILKYFFNFQHFIKFCFIKEILKKKAEVRKWLLEIDVNDPKHLSAIKIGFKMPSGNRYERIFLKTDPINILYKFVFSNEECPINFEIYMNFPRKIINCNEESTTTLEENGINQSMLLFVNDLDA
jgi:FAS-associated factor 2